jgi:hypothetical protein
MLPLLALLPRLLLLIITARSGAHRLAFVFILYLISIFGLFVCHRYLLVR